MSVKVETLEKNMAKLTIEVPAAEVESAMQAVYLRRKNRIDVPGFRKGKAPRHMVEKLYGKGIFLEDAVNDVMPSAYEKAARESGLEIVSRPEIGFEQVEPGKDLIFTAEVAVKPEVTLGEYKGLSVPKTEVNVTEEDVMTEIKREQEKNAVLNSVERPVQDGDQTTIDFEGFMDGVAFEGGKGEDYPLTIGSNAFIPGFEEQLIGAEIGKEAEVNVTFPENYHSEDLAGKPAVFKVTVKDIKEKELPELDDEFASEVSEFETLAEYKEDVKKKLTERKTANAKSIKENAAVDAAIANATMEIPDAMLETQAQNLVDEFATGMRRQGLSMEQYLQYSGNTEDSMIEQMKPRALKQIQTRLVLEAVAKAENIQISEEDTEAELKKMAENYKMELDEIKKLMDDSQIKAMQEDLAVQRAIDLLAESAIETEKKEETETAAE
ncbi:MAG: trigger factor [Lachnospiraceae bacterium]|nr:trigger factor [Lachnospiraceae bacterium]